MTDIINKIYDTGGIPEGLCRSIFIALPKKPATQNHQPDVPHYQTHSEDHHGKSTQQNQNRNWNRTVLFCRRYWHEGEILKVRMKYERAIEKQRDFYICFIDYTKAFDRIQHEELLKMLMNLDLYGKDIGLI